MAGSAAQVRTASCTATSCVNSFGDEQLAVDMLADKLLFEALRFSVRSRDRKLWMPNKELRDLGIIAHLCYLSFSVS